MRFMFILRKNLDHPNEVLFWLCAIPAIFGIVIITTEDGGYDNDFAFGIAVGLFISAIGAVILIIAHHLVFI